MPDLVLYGRVFDQEGNQIITDLTSPDPQPVKIEVKLNDGVGPIGPIVAETTDLLPFNNPEKGELYVLRIRRENGIIQTMENHAISGDRLRIFVNDVEVIETSVSFLFVLGTPTEVVPLNLNDINGDSNPFGDWASSHGLLGDNATPTADPDKDLINNYLEWNYGLNPLLNDSNSERIPYHGIHEEGDARYLTITYYRNKHASQVEAIVQISLDHSIWDSTENSIAQVGSPIDVGEGFERITVRYDTPMRLASESRIFMRVFYKETPGL